MARKLIKNYNYRLSVNSYSKGIKECFAACLRKVADWIDGRITLAVYLDTEPILSIRQKNEILIKGMQHSERLAVDVLRDVLVNEFLVEIYPELFERNEQKQS